MIEFSTLYLHAASGKLFYSYFNLGSPDWQEKKHILVKNNQVLRDFPGTGRNSKIEEIPRASLAAVTCQVLRLSSLAAATCQALRLPPVRPSGCHLPSLAAATCQALPSSRAWSNAEASLCRKTPRKFVHRITQTIHKRA